MKNIVPKNIFFIIILISFSFFQLVYSFLFPSVGFTDSWQPIQTYLPKFKVESQDKTILNQFLPLISSEYRLNSDVSHYLENAKDFNSKFFKNSPILSRPLYSFLIWLASLPVRFFTASSYGIIFGLAILVNFILLVLTVSLLFLFLKNLFSLRTAFLSSTLLIFSPFVHTAIAQPRADLLIAFAAAASSYLLYHYLKKPSALKLIIFSLIVGTLMLGKMFYAIPFFIFLSALYFKRYKEGIIFLAIQAVPVLVWYLWVTRIWAIPYYVHEVNFYQGGIWILHIFQQPWYETYKILLQAFPNFIETLVYAFLLSPLVFSLAGFRKLPFRSGNIFYFGSIFSVFIFSLLANVYYPRLTFLLFPIIYPTAILGMDKVADCLKKYKAWYAPLFYIVTIGVTVIISNINIYHIFDYL